ncbi:MAG: ATP-binding cassette domain-containing protein [Bdellovibrionota bacterium]
METVITAEKLQKTFITSGATYGFLGSIKGLLNPVRNEIEAVKSISFIVNKGERIAFIGPNGAGKSTTIKMLAGILHPTDGELKVAGLNPQKQRQKLAYKIGTVFGQKSQLWPHLPASHTFNLLSKIYDLDEVTYKKRVKDLTEIFSIGPFLEQTVRKMSLGQRMRCEIVASLLHKPEILFLDEPTIGLDIVAKSIIRDLVKTTSELDSTTVFLTSHDTGDMERVCDRVLVINNGEILLDNSISEVRKSYIRRKRITLLTEEENVDIQLKGVKLIESLPHSLKIEVDSNMIAIDTVIQEAFKLTKLRDITVEDPPMEEIVQDIYENFKL